MLYMYHNFFIHSSVVGHLGCFYILPIVSTAATSIGMCVSFWNMVFFWYVPRVGLLDQMVVLFLVFSGISILFPIGHSSIYIPTDSVRRFSFLHTLSSIYCCRFFDDGYSERCEVKLCYSFGFHFFNNDWRSASLHVPVPVCLLWRNFCLDILLFFWLGCVFSIIELHELFVYLGD